MNNSNDNEISLNSEYSSNGNESQRTTLEEIENHRLLKVFN